VAQNIGHIVLMLLLLAGSAFFSGAETAFFSLSHRQINLLKNSKHKLQNLAAELLSRPSQLLSCLLFGNMIVNILFFAAASVLTVRIRQQVGLTAAVVNACLTFCLLVLLGEILPKSLAYANSKSTSVVAALPAFLCLRIFAPVLSVFRFLIVEPIIRLFLGPAKPARPVTKSEFKLLIEQVRKRGLITADENRLLTEIIELGFLKVRDCLRPRVDMIACAVTDPSETARDLMLKNHLTKLPVYVGTIDNIVGLVHLRQLLLQPDTSLDKLVRQVHFAPEQKTVESLLEFFRRTHTDTAIVVDEYGGIAGSVRLEDIAEELLGPIEPASGIEPIEQLGPFEYRLAGDLAIHDWAEAFRIEPAETRLSTIGGLVTALLGKMPQSGDVAHLKNLKFSVERVRKHRIETLILTLEQIPTNGP
jgi:putative hemolysin